MNNIDLIIALVIVGILFFSFFCIISILGYIPLFLIQKRKRKIYQKYSNLEIVIISYGLGIAIYIFLCYILNIFQAFNFFTAYLSILLLDIAFLIYYLIKNGRNIFSKYNKIWIKNHFLKKSDFASLIFISIIFISAFILFWVIISESIGLIKRDPYLWYEDIYFLLEKGLINDVRLGFGYPSGYVFVTSGFLLVWSDPLIGYFFIKMASVYYFFFFIITSYFILKDIFKKNYLIFFSLLLLLISNYFLSRAILNIPSSLASIIVLISFLVIFKQYPYYLLGFFIAAIFLIHPLTLFFYLPVLFIYFLIKFLFNIRNKKLLFKGGLSISFMLIIIIILLLPYMLNYPEEILNLYDWYEKLINEPRFNPNLNNTIIEYIEIKLLRIPLYDFLANFIDRGFLNRFHNITSHSIGIFFFASILGMIINLFYRKKNIVIFNISVLFVLFINFLPYFKTNLDFIDIFKYRSLETFVLPIIIMAIFFFQFVLKIAKKATNLLILKIKSYNLIINKFQPISKILRIDMIILLLLFTNAFIVKFERELPGYSYYYDDDYVEIILYLRRNAESNSIICHPYLERTDIHHILYDMELYHYNFSNTPNLYDFIEDMRYKLTDYFIINNSEITEQWKNNKYYDNWFRKEIINLTDFSLYEFPF